MKKIIINILNPKAVKLLKDLADLNLISIRTNSKNGFSTVLNKLRANSKTSPSLEEITNEVELIRTKRYSK